MNDDFSIVLFLLQLIILVGIFFFFYIIYKLARKVFDKNK